MTTGYLFVFPTFREASTKDNLAPEASCGAETSPGLLTRTCSQSGPSKLPFNRPSVGLFFPISRFFSDFYRETSAQADLTPEASDRPETRLELRTRTCSIRFVLHFFISNRIKQGTQLIPNPINNDYWVRIRLACPPPSCKELMCHKCRGLAHSRGLWTQASLRATFSLALTLALAFAFGAAPRLPAASQILLPLPSP